MSGGSSAGSLPASCSTTATPRPPIGSRATPPFRARTTIAPSTSSPPAGSRCASSTIRATALPISPGSARATATRSRSRAPATGRAAPPRRSGATARRARITRRRRATPPPITARSPARGSATRRSAAPAAGADRPRETMPARGRARDRAALRRSTRATWSPARGRPRRARRATPWRWPRSPRSPPATRMRAPCCCSARARSAAGSRSTTTRSRASACREYRAIGPPIEPARGLFDRPAGKRVQSEDRLERARMGLMQVTPAAGSYIAKKFGAPFDQKRLLTDGLQRADGRGRARRRASGLSRLLHPGVRRLQCRPRPREASGSRSTAIRAIPKVDPIDWVERIPFSETRNYVQRVLENMQVYRVRFGGGSQLLIEADLRRGAARELIQSPRRLAASLPGEGAWPTARRGLSADDTRIESRSSRPRTGCELHVRRYGPRGRAACRSSACRA